MSQILSVRLINKGKSEEYFEVFDSDTNETKTFNSASLHDPKLYDKKFIEHIFLQEFPGKTTCEYTEEARLRIEQIEYLNTIEDKS